MIEPLGDFRPNWVSPPGDTIADLINELNWTQAELAGRLGMSKKHVNRVIKGKVALTEDMAFRLSTVLGSTEQFWLRREANFRMHSARLNAEERYRNWQTWLEKFPIPELIQAGILPDNKLTESEKPKFVESLLRFFGVASPQQWTSQYARKQGQIRRARKHGRNTGAVTAWLRLGEIEANELEQKLNESRQEVRYSSKGFKAAIPEIRKLTVFRPEEFQEKLQHLCLNSGVFLALVPDIPKANISGVARWVSRERPLIQLSLFGKTNDEFWFSFFYAAAHIMLHSNDAEERKHIHVDYRYDDRVSDSIERQAKFWADRVLIPREHYFAFLGLNSIEKVKMFAEKLGIHPGIVVGRLQNYGVIGYSKMNQLKELFELAENQHG